MATYAIGDVQGCYPQLQTLLEHINFNVRSDILWFTGDLVNRGKYSLEVLRFVYSLKHRAVTVLGNHDMHLLALAFGTQRPSSKDTLLSILTAPDCNELIEWLRQCPLLHHDESLGFTMVHAGLPPQWDLSLAKQCAYEVEGLLKADKCKELLSHMYGNKPDHWHDGLTGWDRYRFIINCFCRIRFCDHKGVIDLKAKGDLTTAPEGYMPWFKIPDRKSKELNIIFGHWAALVKNWQEVVSEPGIFPLDSGCVWGHRLSALRLEDKKWFSVDCKR